MYLKRILCGIDMKDEYTLDVMLQEADDKWKYAAVGAAGGSAAELAKIAAPIATQLSQAKDLPQIIGPLYVLGKHLLMAAGPGAAVGFLIGALKDHQVEDSKIKQVIRKFKSKFKIK